MGMQSKEPILFDLFSQFEPISEGHSLPIGDTNTRFCILFGIVDRNFRAFKQLFLVPLSAVVNLFHQKKRKNATLFYPDSSIIAEMRTDEFIKQILPLKNNLFRVAFRITRNTELAEQIVQEAMLKVWSQRDSWIVIEDLPSYCWMVTRNIALQNACRRSSEREPYAIG